MRCREIGGTARDSGYTGCSDAFSVFAFLAFLVALVNILMNNGRKRRRRKREANSESDYVRNLKVAHQI